MSFVGRARAAALIEQLEKKIPFYRLRIAVRPGVTGWAQVRYRLRSVRGRRAREAEVRPVLHQEPQSLFDLWIALKTIKVVVSGSGAR